VAAVTEAVVVVAAMQAAAGAMQWVAAGMRRAVISPAA